MTRADHLATSRHITAMVAADTFELLADRVERLVSHGRRIAMSQRFTYTQDPPELRTGLTVDGQPRRTMDSTGGWFSVALSGTSSFGFATYTSDGDTCEDDAWRRFHEYAAESDDWFKRRRDMTEVDIDGGREDDEPSRDDRIVIRHWNRDGVCTETVVAFD